MLPSQEFDFIAFYIKRDKINGKIQKEKIFITRLVTDIFIYEKCKVIYLKSDRIQMVIMKWQFKTI